jgi:hypothetical protein
MIVSSHLQPFSFGLQDRLALLTRLPMHQTKTLNLLRLGFPGL